MEANCPRCSKRTTFINKEGKYQCSNCQSIVKKCKSRNCNNMIGYGFFCSKCVGKGMKKGGSVAVTVVAVGGGILLKVLLGKNNNKA